VKAHDGTPLNAVMIKPADFEASKKYPVLVYTYGGPHAQVVLKRLGREHRPLAPVDGAEGLRHFFAR